MRTRRNRLLAPYTGFILMFFSSGVMASTGLESSTFVTLMGILLVATIPVILLNISLHRAIRAVKPTAGSTGVKHAVFSVLFFTPFEAALVLPAINLVIADRLLRNQTSIVKKPDKPPEVT